MPRRFLHHERDAVGRLRPVSSDTCSGNNLAAAASCSIAAKFGPAQTGALSGSLSIVDDAAGSLQSVALSGTGILSSPTFSPLSLAFGRAQVGTTSSSKTVTITNPNTLPLEVSSIVVTAPFAAVAD